MFYEAEFDGECQKCGLSISGDVDGLSFGRRALIYRCPKCDRFSAISIPKGFGWFKFSRPKFRQLLFREKYCPYCRDQSIQKPWHILELPWLEKQDGKGFSMETSTSCYVCGERVITKWHLAPDVGIPVESPLGKYIAYILIPLLLIFVFILLLITSPVWASIYFFRVLLRKECFRCKPVEVTTNGWITLSRCSRCGAFYENQGEPGFGDQVSIKSVRDRWSNVKID